MIVRSKFSSVISIMWTERLCFSGSRLWKVSGLATEVLKGNQLWSQVAVGHTELHGHNGNANSPLDELKLQLKFSSWGDDPMSLSGGAWVHKSHLPWRAGSRRGEAFPWGLPLISAWFESHDQKPKPVASLDLFTSQSCPFQSHSSSFAAQSHRRRLTHALVSLRGQDCLRPSLGWSSAAVCLCSSRVLIMKLWQWRRGFVTVSYRIRSSISCKFRDHHWVCWREFKEMMKREMGPSEED